MKRITHRLPLVVLALYGLACLAYRVDTLWHPQWDSGMYILAARSLARHEGYSYLGQPFFLRPPGFSWLLSWFVGREGDYDFYALNRLMMMLGIATVVAAYLVMRRFHRRPQALVVAMLLGTSPLFVAQWNTVMSEFLFLALFFAGLFLVLPKGQGDGRAPWRGLFGALTIAASVYVRTAGIVLLPGLLARSQRTQEGVRGRLGGAAQIVVVMALLLPWMRYASEAERSAPKPATQMLNFNYTAPLLRVNPRDPDSGYLGLDAWKKRLSANTTILVGEMERHVFFSEGWPAHVACLVAILGFVLKIRGGASLLEWLTLSYGALLLIYPYYESRLILPLAFLAYHYLLVVVEAAAAGCEGRFGTGRPVVFASVALAAFLLCCNLLAMPEYAKATKTSAEFPLAPAVAWVKRSTPKDAVILVDHAPEFSVLSGRVSYSYLHLGKAPFPAADYIILRGPPAAFEAELTQKNLGFARLPSDRDPDGIRIYRVR